MQKEFSTSGGRRKREPFPYFPCYPRDWLESETVTAMTLEQQGLYWRYICIHMRQDSIPADSAMRAKVAGIPPRTERRLWPAIAECFRPDPADPTRLVNAKCLKVLGGIDAMRDLQTARVSKRYSGKNPNSIETESELSSNSVPTQLELTSGSVAATPLVSTKGFYRGSTSQSQSQSQSQTEEEETLKARPTATPQAPKDDPSFFQSRATDDRPDPTPDAGAGTSGKWNPTPAEAANLAGLMAESTGKQDPPFAAGILQVAADGSKAAKSYGEVESCVRDAAANSAAPIRKNAYFRKAVAERFGADLVVPLDVRAAAKALSINRPASPADVEANRERNRRQLAELQANGAGRLGPEFEEFLRAAEAAAKGTQ